MQYMFAGMPDTRSGNFSMSIISIGSSFERHSAGDGYRSGTFERFRRNLDVIRDRVETQFIGAQYPQGSTFAGKTFDPANGTISKHSPDVMIPAFLAAYTGRNARNSVLDFFPSPILHDAELAHYLYWTHQDSLVQKEFPQRQSESRLPEYI